MRIKKNKIYQYIFLLTLTLMAIFNGGNNNLYIQFNFIIISIFFLFSQLESEASFDPHSWPPLLSLFPHYQLDSLVLFSAQYQ